MERAEEALGSLAESRGIVTAEEQMLEALMRRLDPDYVDPAEVRARAVAERLGSVVDPEVPDWGGRLDEEGWRNIVMYGGRGGAKSWTVARKLLTRGAREPIRVLCTREHQVSIKDSVHQLLKDQIAILGLLRYEITNTEIRHPNGTRFIFKGLTDPDAVKSAEGIDVVWVEEAQRVSKASLKTLLPTVRKPGSQIWFTFNPDQEDDPVYDLVKNPPPRTMLLSVGWRENPFMTAELVELKDHAFKTDPVAAAHVWDGAFRTGHEAQVLKDKYVSYAFEPDPAWEGPYYGMDFGFSQDPMALVELYIETLPKPEGWPKKVPAPEKLYVYREAWKLELDIHLYLGFVDVVMPGASKQLIRADSASPGNISFLRQHGFPKIVGVEKWPGSIEDGITYLRHFEVIVIHPRCVHTLEEARLYSYKVDKRTSAVLADIVDQHNHTIDGKRYALAPMIKNARRRVWLGK